MNWKDIVRPKYTWIIPALTGLLLMYLFQDADFASIVSIRSWPGNFIFNRLFRFLLNDLLVLALVYGLFGRQKYVLLGFYIQLFGLFFILVPYLIIKINYPSQAGAFFSFLHRLVVNPLLLLMLIPAIFYAEINNLTQK